MKCEDPERRLAEEQFFAATATGKKKKKPSPPSPSPPAPAWNATRDKFHACTASERMKILCSSAHDTFETHIGAMLTMHGEVDARELRDHMDRHGYPFVAERDGERDAKYAYHHLESDGSIVLVSHRSDTSRYVGHFYVPQTC
jgi:hypothetical protein